eukprot:m.42644 g.42644  ORF g.42644 m.42644 type:complete len:94 (+) comp11561_c1_seq1:311-592(+)
MFSIGSLLEVALLVVNGLAVLQDYSPGLAPNHSQRIPRFLAKVGWAETTDTFGSTEPSIKDKIVHMINAVRTLLRLPLIGLNLLTIVYLLFFG